MLRRDFLALAALLPWTTAAAGRALAAAAGDVIPGSPGLTQLRRALLVEAAEAQDPWSICHAMLGAGPGLRLKSGAVAVEFMIDTFLKRDADGGAWFERGGSGGVLGEQHPHLVLKKLIEMKLHPELWKPLTETALRTLKLPSTQNGWDDVTWLLWSVAQQPGYTAETRVGGGTLRLGDLALGALDRAERADQPVEASLKANGVERFVRLSASDPASRDSVWGFTCGGQHFLQTVMACQKSGLLPSATRSRTEARLATFLKRVEGEGNFRTAEKQKALAAGVDTATAEHQTALALLKLHGHALETLGRARDAGFGAKPALLAAAGDIRKKLEASQLGFQMKINLAALLPSLRAKNPSYWRLWLGDGCHALHGLEYWS